MATGSFLDLMGATAGALALIDRLAENPVDVDELRPEGTYSRVSAATLKNKLAMLSKLLNAPAWPARGAIGIDQAYGGYRLVQRVGEGSAEQDLSPRLKASELAHFLDGAVMVARAVK